MVSAHTWKRAMGVGFRRKGGQSKATMGRKAPTPRHGMGVRNPEQFTEKNVMARKYVFAADLAAELNRRVEAAGACVADHEGSRTAIHGKNGSGGWITGRSGRKGKLSPQGRRGIMLGQKLRWAKKKGDVVGMEIASAQKAVDAYKKAKK